MRTFGTIILISLLLSSSVYPGIKTFVRDYTFEAGEADSKLTARAYALEQVKRKLLEEVGIYIRSTFENVDSERIVREKHEFESLTKQQTTAITAGITETKVLDELWDGLHYYIKAQITLDPDDVLKKVHEIMGMEENLAAMEESRRKADDALAEATRLREELKEAKNEVERLKLGKLLEKETNVLTAADWFEKGYKAGADGHFQDAISSYSKVIGLDSNYVEAYNNRGAARFLLKDYGGAIADYGSAIRLKSDYAQVYYNRGVARFEIQDYVGATADFDRAIQIKPNYVLAYYNRGIVRSNVRDYRGAIADQSKVIELRSDDVLAYYSRGTARYQFGDYKGAMTDLSKAIELQPDGGKYYLARGMVLEAIGEAQAAGIDFRRAKALGCTVPEEWLEKKK